MSNKKIGNDFEQAFCEELADYGFWVHNFTQNKDGQPADVIAVRKGKAYLIDCKVCSDGEPFALSRIEENQELAMTLWESCGNGSGWFAIYFADNGHTYMVRLLDLLLLRSKRSTVDERMIALLSSTLEWWVTWN